MTRAISSAAALVAVLGCGLLAAGAGVVGQPPVSGPAPLIAFSTGGEGVADTLDIGVSRPDGSGFRNLTRHDVGGSNPVWTSDGRGLIVWTSGSSASHGALWWLRPDGRQRRRLPGATVWDVPSPDGRLVALPADTRPEVVLRDAAGRLVRRLAVRLTDADYYTFPLVWSPNGRYLVLCVGTETATTDIGRMFLIPVDGRRPARLVARTRDPEDLVAAFSPDSRRLLYVAGGHAHVTSVDGGSRYALRGGIGTAGSASWSPDGRRIAYLGKRGGIYVTGAHDGRGRLVARTLSAPIQLEWAPRGNTIAFSEKTGLYLVAAGGGPSRRLTAACSFCFPSWRPDGRELAFSRDGLVFEVSARAGTLRTVAGPPLSADSPAWSPDRSLIAFTRGTEGLANEQTLGVFVIRPDGTGLRRLGRGYRPQWAADSRRVVYVDPVGSPDPASWGEERTGRIVVAGLDGSSKQVGTGMEPAWSPDGTTIAFVRFTFGTRRARSGAYKDIVGSTLFLVRADGSGERSLLTSEDDKPFFTPRWAPDGSAIAVAQELATYNEGGEGDYSRQLALVDPTTGAERLLPLTDPYELRWSPGSREVLVMDSDSIRALDVRTGKGRTILTAKDSLDEKLDFAVWSPDGTRIAYARCVHYDDPELAECDVWTAARDGSNRVRVTRTPGVEGELAWAS